MIEHKTMHMRLFLVVIRRYVIGDYTFEILNWPTLDAVGSSLKDAVG